MLSESFMRLNAYGAELCQNSKGTTPMLFEKMAMIDSLVVTCRGLARTDEEKSIVSRAQAFWDACFRKWYDSVPEELKENLGIVKKETKTQPPGRFEKVAMFRALVAAVRTMKSDQDLAKMTSDDFNQVIKLVEQCASITTTKLEKK